MRRESEIEFEEAGIAHHLGREFTGERGQPGGGSEHDSLIAGFVIAVVQRFLAGLWDNSRASVHKANHRRHVKDVLIESAKEKDAVVVDGTTQCEAELLLLGVWLEIESWLGRSEGAVSNEIKIGSMQLVRSRFCHHVDHRASGSSQFRTVRIRRDAELLDDFFGELIRSAIAAASLREKRVVVVSPVDQITRLISANAAKSQIAIRPRSQPARVLCYSGCE